jgi:hypothetical protein
MSEREFPLSSSTELVSNATTTLHYQEPPVTNASMHQNNAAPPRRERLAHRFGALAGNAVEREQQQLISYDNSAPEPRIAFQLTQAWHPS